MISERRASRICSGRRPARNAVWLAMSAPDVPVHRCLPLFFEPNSGLDCAEGRLCRAVLCETREEPFQRPLPDLVADPCGPLFLQDCVAVNPQDVVDTADS